MHKLLHWPVVIASVEIAANMGNSADELCHPRSVDYSVEIVLLNKQQFSGGGACLTVTLKCMWKNVSVWLTWNVRSIQNGRGYNADVRMSQRV